MNPRTRRRLILSGTVAGSLVVIAIGGVLARNWYRSRQVGESRRIGMELFAAGQYKEALAPLSTASRGGTDLEVLLALAEARMAVPEPSMRHMKVAASMYNNAETLDPKGLRALRGQLECAIALGYLSEIPPIVDKILAVDPQVVRAHEAMLEVRAAQGRWSDALTAAETLQKLQPQEIRWRAVQLQCLASGGADSEGRLALVRKWRAELPASPTNSGSSTASVSSMIPGLAILEADLLRGTGRVAQARDMYASLIATGVSEPAVLTALLEGLESTGLSSRAEEAINASRPLFPDPLAIVELEGDRLLAAGRLNELRDRMASVDSSKPSVRRLRFAAEYLSGDRAAAARVLAATTDIDDATDPFLSAASIALGDGARRGRIEQIEQNVQQPSRDPVVAVMLSDLLVESGEYDSALNLLIRAFDQSGRRSQPVGLRAVRISAGVGRIPDALGIARDLGLRYQSDASVAAAILEAWASALQVGYVPSRVFGALGTDSPDGLANYWEAMGKPPELAPLVAEVFARRGMKDRAKSIVSELANTMDDGDALLSLMPIAYQIDPEFAASLLARASSRPLGASGAIEIAGNYERAGKRDDAVRVIDAALTAANSNEKISLERVRRALLAPVGAPTDGSSDWLLQELKSDPSLECASFVLSRSEVWSTDPSVAARNAEIVAAAVAIVREAVGGGSQRAIVAEATMNLVFHSGDMARIASSLAALALAERRSPDSVSILTTFARLLEVDSPPDPVRAATLLSRAAQLQPGSADLYPDLVRVLQQIGDYNGAEQAIDAYARLVGDDIAGNRRAATLREDQGQFDEAATMRAKLVERTRASVDRLALIRTNIRSGKTEEAEQELRALLATDSTVLAARELALLLARDGRIDEARTTLRDLPRAGSIDAVQAELEAGFGDPNIALRFARAAAASSPTAASDLLVARVLIQLSQFDEARSLLVSAISKSPDDPNILPIAAAVLVGDLSAEGRAALRTALDAARAVRPDFVAAIALIDGATTSSGDIAPDVDDLRAARELTVRYSGSPLIWRLATQCFSAAGQSDEAARLALIALSRLPSDEATAELAVRMSIEAGRVDDAAAAASAWRRINGADLLAADSARALIAILQRDPSRARTDLAIHQKAILAKRSANEPLTLLIASYVMAGKSGELNDLLASLDAERRSLAVSIWIQSAQTLTLEDARLATLDALRFAGNSDDLVSACVSVLTQFCRLGDAESCAAAMEGFAKLGDGGIPKPLLEADLLAARGDFLGAKARYESLYKDAVGGLDADLDAVASAITRDPAMRARFESNPVAIAAMNNLADALIQRGEDIALATKLARCVAAILPESSEACDTLAKSIIASGDFSEARAIASRNSDRLLGSVELAEVELAAKDLVASRRATLQSELLLVRVSLPPRLILDRLDAVKRALQRFDDEQQGAGR